MCASSPPPHVVKNDDEFQLARVKDRLIEERRYTVRRGEGKWFRWLVLGTLGLDSVVLLSPVRADDNLIEHVRSVQPQLRGNLYTAGLRKSVEIIRDRWGIAHIYAKNTHDLFFAQGFVAGQDHMWALELWRRNAEGKLAEVLGPKYLERDKFARVLRYRGDWEAELIKYHQEGPLIFSAFAAGVNASIKHALARKRVPVEFDLSGFQPEPVWTAQTLLSRMPVWAITRNIDAELAYALAAKSMGLERLKEIAVTDPPTELTWPDGLDPADINPKILDIARGANAFNFSVQSPEPSVSATAVAELSIDDARSTMGSNNWVVGGKKSATGMPLLANDPHRVLQNPTLRYWVHLVAPGWNVMGVTELGLPGVSIGHNERVGWGFTVLMGDQADLYVEQTRSGDPDQYRFRGEWKRMKIDVEEIAIKGVGVERFRVKTTVHGPLVYEDPIGHRAYALRWTGFETGGHGYLGSLNLLQAHDWPDFTRRAAHSWYANHSLVYADVDGNYGYLSTGLTPRRVGWNGLFPVPGHEGKYEWDGYIPTDLLPRSLNGAAGFYASANNNVFPSIFPGASAPPFSYEYVTPFRYERIVEILSEDRKFSVRDLQKMQGDVLSRVAGRLVSLLKDAQSDKPEVRAAIDELSRWNFQVNADSVAAAIYEFWYLKLSQLVYAKKLPSTSAASIRFDTRRVLAWVERPDADFGTDPVAERNRLLVTALEQALESLRLLAGNDRAKWAWGSIHQARFVHPLENQNAAAIFKIAPVPRSGDDQTIQVTGGASEKGAEQRGGATVMFVFDVQNWDRSVGLNAPGNESQIGSAHYSDLIPLWRDNEPFPLFFSKQKVRSAALNRVTLLPQVARGE